jgi:hypothetical protein
MAVPLIKNSAQPGKISLEFIALLAKTLSRKPGNQIDLDRGQSHN